MKIKVLGAAGTVTGSSFRLEMESGKAILLDCGLFQGGRQTEVRNSNSRPYDPLNLSGLVITHAHMDHSGLVPRLVKQGYNGPVYATEATCELLKVLWLDAAHIQEHEAVWKSRKNRRQGQRDVEPLYDENDARKAMSMLEPVPFYKEVAVLPSLHMSYHPVGHILGAACVHFAAKENGASHTVNFSGDIGRTEQLLMPPPSNPPQAQTLFMETTYGNRLHKEMTPSIDEFLAAINTAYAENGKILIPAFAVERTQEILLLLHQAKQAGKIPENLPVYMDSPLAQASTEIYTHHINLADEDARDFLRAVASNSIKNLHFTKDAQESQKLNDLKGSAIIIAGSGMANAGRILHHLKHNLWQPNCHVIFVGFQAMGTTGRRLVEGAKVVKIFRDAVNVEAKIHTIGGFSGHADQNELLQWLEKQAHPGLTVNLIHGEPTSTKTFCDLAKEKFPEVNFNIPDWLQYAALSAGHSAEEYDLASATMPLPPSEDPAVSSLLNRISRLQGMAENLDAPLSPIQLAILETYMEHVESVLLTQQKHQ